MKFYSVLILFVFPLTVVSYGQEVRSYRLGEIDGKKAYISESDTVIFGPYKQAGNVGTSKIYYNGKTYSVIVSENQDLTVQSFLDPTGLKLGSVQLSGKDKYDITLEDGSLITYYDDGSITYTKNGATILSAQQKNIGGQKTTIISILDRNNLNDIVLFATLEREPAKRRKLDQQFASGYIITSKKDSIHGLVLDGTDAELGTKVVFKKSEQEEPTTYGTGELSGFGFDYGKRFYRFAFVKDIAKPSDSVSFFAKKTVTGKITLFAYEKPDTSEPDIVLKNNATGVIVYMVVPQNKIRTDENGHQKMINASYKHVGQMSLVMSDLNYPGKTLEKFKYDGRKITKDILAYDNRFKAGFPVTRYTPKPHFTYDVTAGIPIQKYHNETGYRVALYLHKYFPDKSRNVSIIRGITYRHWANHRKSYAYVQDSNEGVNNHLISVIPLGGCYETNGEILRAYAYIGLGFTVTHGTEKTIADFTDLGDRTVNSAYPSMVIGGGFKIKAGSKFVKIEWTPTGGDGKFINVGMSL